MCSLVVRLRILKCKQKDNKKAFKFQMKILEMNNIKILIELYKSVMKKLMPCYFENPICSILAVLK